MLPPSLYEKLAVLEVVLRRRTRQPGPSWSTAYHRLALQNTGHRPTRQVGPRLPLSRVRPSSGARCSSSESRRCQLRLIGHGAPKVLACYSQAVGRPVRDDLEGRVAWENGHPRKSGPGQRKDLARAHEPGRLDYRLPNYLVPRPAEHFLGRVHDLSRPPRPQSREARPFSLHVCCCRRWVRTTLLLYASLRSARLPRTAG